MNELPSTLLAMGTLILPSHYRSPISILTIQFESVFISRSILSSVSAFSDLNKTRGFSFYCVSFIDEYLTEK